MSRSNDDRDRLILDNLRLARWHASRHRNLEPYISYADLYQSACIGLVKAADTWDGDRSPFAAWATFKIRGEVAAEIRTMRRRIHVPRGERHCTWEPLPDEQPDGSTSAPPEIHEQIADLLSHLSERTRLIVSLHFGLLDGSPWHSTDIARKLGVSHTTVDNRLRDALSLLRTLAARP